jgi:AcrR family transcriptional regulator
MLREKRKEIVLQCAKEVFSKKGYYKTSISDIIQQAGIARGTFYLYFQDKRHIFDSVLDMILEELGTIIKRIDLEPGSSPPLEQLKEILISLIKLALEDRELTQILLNRAVELDHELESKLFDFYEALLAKIEAALRNGIELGLVRNCDTKVTARCIMGCMKEVINFISSEDEAVFQIDSILDEVLNFGMRGVLIAQTV